jgi:hypothetical protein
MSGSPHEEFFFPIKLDDLVDLIKKLKGRASFTGHIIGEGTLWPRGGRPKQTFVVVSWRMSGMNVVYPVVLPEDMCFAATLSIAADRKSGPRVIMAFKPAKKGGMVGISSVKVTKPVEDILPWRETIEYAKEDGVWTVVAVDGRELEQKTAE